MSFDPSKPVKTDNYDTGFLSTLRANVLAAAMWLDSGAAGTISNPVAEMKRFNAGTKLFERWTGTAWAELSTGYLKDVAPTTYGSLRLTRSTGGYGGIQFPNGANIRNFMVRDSDGLSGLYDQQTASWIWQFSGSGALAVGTVPWGRITGAPAITGLTADESPTGSTVVRRNASGHVFAAYLNQSSANSENPSINQVMVTNGTDGYLRKASLAHLGNNITVLWANVSGRPSDLGSFTNGPGYITSGALAPYAALSSSPSFTGRVYGNGGGSGLGKILVQSGGTPPAMSPGDLCLIY
ncbi:MAG: hypothetical protein ACOZJZ_12680 [Pseudomonadota bacterium]